MDHLKFPRGTETALIYDSLAKSEHKYSISTQIIAKITVDAVEVA